MEKVITQLQAHLADNKVELALTKLKSIFSLSNSELVNDVILMTAQFKKLKSDSRKGIIDYTQESLRHNKIVNSILELVNEMKNDPDLLTKFNKVESELDQSIQKKGRKALPPSIKDALFERLSYVKEKKLKLKVLWIDDIPAGNIYESKILENIGIDIDFAKTSAAAYEAIKANHYELILSDISREDNDTEGLSFHRKLLTEAIDLPMIFYTGAVDHAKGVPPYAFGIADLPNDLIHLVLDVIERKY